MGVAPPASTAYMIASASEKLAGPCSMSTVTKSMPLRARMFATVGDAVCSQVPNTVAPASSCSLTRLTGAIDH